MSSQIEYLTQPTQSDPVMRRIAAGFMLMAIASLTLAALSGLQVMASDLSILPVNSRMGLLGLSRIARFGIEFPAAVLLVIGFRLASRHHGGTSGIPRRLSNGAYIAAFVVALLIEAEHYGIYASLGWVDRWAPDIMEHFALVYCVQSMITWTLAIVASWIIMLAIYRVLAPLQLKNAASECLLLGVVISLYSAIQLVLSLASYASYRGEIDYSTARMIMMFSAIGTLVQLVMLSCMSIFLIRTWKIIRKRGNKC